MSLKTIAIDDYGSHDHEEVVQDQSSSAVKRTVAVAIIVFVAVAGYKYAGASVEVASAVDMDGSMSVAEAEAAAKRDFGAVTAETLAAEATMAKFGVRLAESTSEQSSTFSGTTTAGWCDDWDSQGVNDASGTRVQHPSVTTAAQCYATCDNTAGCTQAVFETGGQWNEQCWLGAVLMSNPVDRASRSSCANTAGCSDTCYQSTYQPAGSITAGWCADWEHTSTRNGGLGMIGDDSSTQADCFIACDNTQGCTQAVFETGGQWGNECWLGSAVMSNPVARGDRPSCTNTAGCSNTCYQSTYQPTGSITAGWCADWEQSSIRNGGLGMVGDDSSTQADCFIACDNTPGCTQAVFETGGAWDNECWLGSAVMSNPIDRAHRPSCTNNAGCSNSCYHKEYAGTTTAGWCGDWDSQGVNDASGSRVQNPSVTTMEECFVACDDTPSCTQAVFETGGQWNEQCWLGAQLMASPLDRSSRPSCENTAGCSDTCYQSTHRPAGTITAGWCTNWDSAGVFTADNVRVRNPTVTTEADCFTSCDNTASCTQAVFETGGQWNEQCWLGSVDMAELVEADGVGRPSCENTNGCIDSCYTAVRVTA